MKEQFFIDIKNVEGSADKLKEFINLEDDELRVGVERLLNTADLETYNDFSEENKSKILQLFSNRNLAFSDITNSFNVL